MTEPIDLFATVSNNQRQKGNIKQDIMKGFQLKFADVTPMALGTSGVLAHER